MKTLVAATLVVTLVAAPALAQVAEPRGCQCQGDH